MLRPASASVRHRCAITKSRLPDASGRRPQGRRIIPRMRLMNVLGPMTRRNVVGGLAASAIPLGFPKLATAQAAARVVVVGGGFGGVACARGLGGNEGRVRGTDIEPDPQFT